MTHRTPNFKVGDRVDHVFADTEAGLAGRVMAVLNYGKVLTVQWATGSVANHAAHCLIPHQEG